MNSNCYYGGVFCARAPQTGRVIVDAVINDRVGFRIMPPV